MHRLGFNSPCHGRRAGNGGLDPPDLSLEFLEGENCYGNQTRPERNFGRVAADFVAFLVGGPLHARAIILVSESCARFPAASGKFIQVPGDQSTSASPGAKYPRETPGNAHITASQCRVR